MRRRAQLGGASTSESVIVSWGRRALVAALLLWLVTPFLPAQTPSRTRLPSLKFFSFRVGVPLEHVATTAANWGGSPLDCRQSVVDPDVLDCRSSFADPITAASIDLWLSAMDSLVGVLTVSGEVSGLQLDGWRSSLISAYGDAQVTTQGSQRTLQWIRHRQMLRLTWRDIDGTTSASVSLIDGPVLDGWGRRRRDVTGGSSSQ